MYKAGEGMKNADRKLFSIFDIIVVAVVLISAVVSFLCVFSPENDEMYCVVKYNGEVVYSEKLENIKEPVEMTFDGDLDVTVVMSNSGVLVKNSACPDKLCEHTGEINSVGQSIVCLPAKISVSLVTTDVENSLDAVVG